MVDVNQAGVRFARALSSLALNDVGVGVVADAQGVEVQGCVVLGRVAVLSSCETCEMREISELERVSNDLPLISVVGFADMMVVELYERSDMGICALNVEYRVVVR